MIATPMQESLPIRKRERKIIARRNYPLKTRRKCSPILFYKLYIFYLYYIVPQRIYGKAPAALLLFALAHLSIGDRLLAIGTPRLLRADLLDLYVLNCNRSDT